MASPANISREFGINKEDPDSWCTVGLLTNTECHQLIIVDETGLESFSDLPAGEQHSIAAHLGTDAVQTVCYHHQKYYLCTERRKQGCLDRFHLHESESAPTRLVTVTRLLAESCRDVATLEEGERICQLCIDEIMKKQDSSVGAPSLPFAVVFSSKEYQDRAKRIDDILTRCSVGLMTRSSCHITQDSFEDSVRAFSALPRPTAKTLVSHFGRAFETICMHHELVYLGGYAAPCCNPEKKHSNRNSSSQKWLVPRRFALECRGKFPIKPGRTVCLKCLKGLYTKYPEIKAFYMGDERAIEEALATIDDGTEEKGKAEAKQDTHQGSDAENASMKAESSSAKFDSLGRRKRRSDITATERELRNLRVDNLEFRDIPGSGHREKREITKKTKDFLETSESSKRRSTRQHAAQGDRMGSKKDTCDCLQVECPGCHFPCAKCGSPKCGVECRRNRKWAYKQLEIDGVPDTVYENTFLN